MKIRKNNPNEMICISEAFVRLRANWIEEGEKDSSYFSNLEKRRQENKAVKSLLINEVECKDTKTIEKDVFSFYNNLDSSAYSLTDSAALKKKRRKNLR